MESNGDFLSAVEHRNGVYYSIGICGGCVRFGSTNPDPISKKNYVNFLYPFSDLFSKIHTIFKFVVLNPYPCFIFRL